MSLNKFFSKKAASVPTNIDKLDIHTLESNLEISTFLLSCEQGDISTLRSVLIKYDDVHCDEEEEEENNQNLQHLLNYKDNNTNKTGLIYACIAGHIDIVDELIKHGANIEKCHDGSTPLYHATSRGHIDVVKKLLNYDANVNAINNKGWTALMNAAYFGRDDIVKLLLEYKANPDIIRNEFDGKTALHFACKNARYQVVELLLDYGANPNIGDRCDKTTALMYSAMMGYQEIIELLILYGADPLIINLNGKKAIDFIEYNENIDSNNDDDDEFVVDDDDDDDDGDREKIKCQQKHLYLLLNESNNIYSGICKLIYPQKMRLILQSMNNLHNIYPVIKSKIITTKHVSSLYLINNIDISSFNDLCMNDIKKTLIDLKPYNIESDQHIDGDRNNEYEIVLNKFKNDILITTEQCNIYKQNVLKNDNDIKQIEIEIINKKKNMNDLNHQISLLKQQLIETENDAILLQKKLIQKQSKINNLNCKLSIFQHKLNINDKMFELMAKATSNIKSVCDKADKLPIQYSSDLQFIYQKKKKLLETNWKSWNLQDIISWISNLDLNGKFKKYIKNLQKLCELEEHHDDNDNDNDWNDDNNDIETRSDDEGQEINDIDNKNNKNNKQESKNKNIAILELINDTVLKLCGIHDCYDRKVIMMNIESLRKGNDDEGINNNDHDEKQLNDSDDDILSNKFLCPISKCIMKDPVICSDGFSYERQAIQQWLLNNDISPITKQKLSTKQLFTNQNLKAMICEYNQNNT